MLRKLGRLPGFPAYIEYGDIVRGLPVRDGSCELAYSSHVLEHLALSDLRVALRNTHRYLRPGGTFRLVLPDLERFARDYLASDDPQAGNRFLSDARLGTLVRTRGMTEVVRAQFGSSAHLWMWDYKGLAAELAEAGFTGIRRAQFGDSADSRFRDVEILERWNGCLGIECTR
jgi:predicted SAM-dependent methyltransferase